MLQLTLDGITPLLIELRRRAWAGWTRSGKGVTPLLDAHAAIFDRIAAHDIDGAGAAMHDHLLQAYEGLHT
jgi:DNA-binding GntR family transcriptional regulator